jgi:hypothetical protein
VAEQDRPRFKVLDVVEARGEGRGIVCQVRRYADRGFVYSLAGLDGLLCEERDLVPTGERASPKDFRLPGRFHTRDEVRISPDCPDREIAGRVGSVMAAGAGGEDADLAVWIEGRGEVDMVEPRFLEHTGRRLPPAALGTARSSRVTEDGEVVGQDVYEVVDDVDRYV